MTAKSVIIVKKHVLSFLQCTQTLYDNTFFSCSTFLIMIYRLNKLKTYHNLPVVKPGLFEMKTYTKSLTGQIKTFIGRLLNIFCRYSRTLSRNENEKRLLLALEGNRDGIWDWDAKTDTVYFSPRWKEMIGFGDDEIPNQLEEWDKRIHPDDREKVYKDLNRHLSGETGFYENEHRLKCRDGTYKWILDRGKVVEWSFDGKPKRIIGTHTDIQDRKKTEESLNNLFHLSLDLICVAGIDGHFKQLNPSWARVLGWSEKELKSRPWIDFVYPEDIESTIQAGRKLQEGERVVNFENRYLCRDGSFRWLSWNSTPLVNENTIYAVARDITEKKQLEQTLTKSEAHFKSLFQGIPIPAYTWRKTEDDFVLTNFNRAAFENTGGKIENLVGITASRMYEDQLNIREDLNDCFQNETVLRKEMYYHMKTTGQWRYLDVSYVFVPGEYVMALTEDITDRKLNELEIRKLSMAVEQSSSPIIITDTEGEIEYVNKKFTEVSGFDYDEAIGKNPRILKSDRHDKQFYENMWETITSGRQWTSELCNKRKNGSEYWVKASISPIINGKNKIVNYVSIQEDISRLRELAMTDELTGLYNRRFFFEEAGQEFVRSKRYQLPLSLVILDVDHFKSINDQYGHDVGDFTLKRLADNIRENVRTIDIPGRLGGEEFAILLPQTDILSAATIAERIRTTIESLEFTIHNVSYPITVSLGISAMLNETQNFDTLLKEADMALYDAKDNGRNRIHVYETSLAIS